MINVLTIVAEDYFLVNAYVGHVRQNHWTDLTSQRGRKHALYSRYAGPFLHQGGLLYSRLGSERLPTLTRKIHRRCHEMACNGYGHEILYMIGFRRLAVLQNLAARLDVPKAERNYLNTGLGFQY
jgi:hypothetical protein